MKPIPATPEIVAVARKVVWFEPPEKALADPIRFMAYAMTYAVPEDMRLIRRFVSDDDFREALEHAPAGIIDPRSWAYWNSKMGRDPPPRLPARHFGIPAGSEAPVDGQRSPWLVHTLFASAKFANVGRSATGLCRSDRRHETIGLAECSAAHRDASGHTWRRSDLYRQRPRAMITCGNRQPEVIYEKDLIGDRGSDAM